MSCDVSPVAMFLLVLINCCKLAIFVVRFKNDIKLWRERDWSANQKYSFCISPCLTQLIGPLKTQFPVVKYILARFFKYQTLSFDIVYDFVFVFFCVFVNTVWWCFCLPVHNSWHFSWATSRCSQPYRARNVSFMKLMKFYVFCRNPILCKWVKAKWWILEIFGM